MLLKRARRRSRNRLFAARRLAAREVITARFPLEQVLAAFDRTAERRDGKVLVVA